MAFRLVKAAPGLTLLLLVMPMLFGLTGTILPAIGYLPALGGHDFTTEHFSAFFAQPAIGRSIMQALGVGLASAVISVGLVALFVAGWYGKPVFRALQALVSPLLSVPHAAAAFGLAFMIMPSGFFSRLLSPWLTGWQSPPDVLIINDPMGLALIAGLVVKEIPFLLLVTLAALPQVPAQRARSLAQSLGYGATIGMLLTAWPMIYRQIRLAVFAVIAYASSVVDVSIILGPSVPATLPVRLVEWMNDPMLETRFMACAGACIQIGVTAASLLIWIGFEKLASFMARLALERGYRVRRDQALRWLTLLAIGASALVVFGGLAVLALWSVAGLWTYPDVLPANLSLRMWNRSLPGAITPLMTTISIGITATLISTLLVIGCLVREQQTGRTGGQRALALLYLPLLVPQTGFLFGLQFLFVASDTDASFGALVLAHMVFVLPYVFLSLSAPWRAYDIRYERVAAGLGVSTGRIFWRVRMPMLLRAILAAMAVGFAVSVSQYLPTLLVGAGRFATITTEAVALGTGGNRRVVGVYAFLQMALPFIGFALATAIPALIFRNRRAISVG
ncbi:MAG: ABC transporter permease [Ahrensia sp.]